MKAKVIIILFLLCLIAAGCITKFIPEVNGNKNLLVVEGLVTDQCETYTVKLSTSSPLGQNAEANPVSGAQVTISDDKGDVYVLPEKTPGFYLSDSTIFRGIAGRKYSLQIRVQKSPENYYNYESLPMELIPVPPIDSIFYKKVTLKGSDKFYERIEACQIYVDTHDDSGICRYYKWNYIETWEFRLHWDHPNKVCWITTKSENINIKNTSDLTVDRVSMYPLNYISNTTDKVEVKYSILVNQYSVSQDEYVYWEKLKNFSEDIGGLYDQIPAFIPGNISCVNDPSEQVLGYFSVSARSSQRIFIKDNFAGQINLYKGCPTETIINPPAIIPGLDSYVWILENHPFFTPPVIVLTDQKGCIDCTVRGTNIKPAFWDDI